MIPPLVSHTSIEVSKPHDVIIMRFLYTLFPRHLVVACRTCPEPMSHTNCVAKKNKSRFMDVPHTSNLHLVPSPPAL